MLVSAVIGFIKENIACDILVLMGIGAILMTYVLAPRASQKEGHYVSGIPAVGGILIALGFLTSSVKWLALLGLADPGLSFLLFRGIPDLILYRRELKNEIPPEEYDGARVVEYSTYNKCYDEIRRPIKDYPNSYTTHTIVRYIITDDGGRYKLLGYDNAKRYITLSKHSTVEKCKKAESKKANWLER